MPILDDIMDHDLLGPKIREGITIGRQEGRQEGLQEGLQQGLQQGRGVVRRLLEKRFGPLPEWAGERVERLSAAEFEEVALRVLDAGSLEEVFR